MAESNKKVRGRYSAANAKPVDIQKILSQAQLSVMKAQDLVSRVTAPTAIPPFQQQKSYSRLEKVNVKNNTQINLVNCENVQIGDSNTMIIQHPCRATSAGSESSSDSDVDDDVKEVVDTEKEKQLMSSKRKVSEMELRNLSEQIGGRWRQFARRLGIEDSDIEYIHKENISEDMQETVYQLLLKWKREDTNPTVSTLMKALKYSELCHLYKYLSP